MKSIYKSALLALFAVALASCSSTTNWKVKAIEGKLITLDSRFDSKADTALAARINYYKVSLDSIMSGVVGVAAEPLNNGGKEVGLVTLGSDMLKEQAILATNEAVDFAILNTGGVRASFRKGDITLGDIFSSFPFENRLTLLSMKGSDLIDLFEHSYRLGIGTSKEVKLVYAADQSLKSVTIHNKAIDPNKVYIVATIDYLAGGNDGLTALTRTVKRVDTGATLRQLMINAITEKQSRGEKLAAPKDKRVVRL